MAVSGLQKLTVAAALVLCAALILPRLVLRRDPSEETGGGRFPPMMHRHVTPDLRGQRSAGVRGHGEVRGTGSGGAGSGGGGAGTGSGPGGKSNLAAQIIPVYGFGILLYILYILFKITSKGHSKPSQGRLHSLRSESSKRKITDFELSQLQERLRETELVMENLVNTSLQEEEEDIAVSVSLDQEQTLLQQLTEITRAMKSDHLQDFTNTNPTEETESMDDFDPFWSHCTCPQTHEEEEQQTHEEEEQQTHEEEEQQTHEEEEQQTHEEEEQQTHEEEEQQTVPEGLSEEDQETKEETRETEPQTEEEVLLKVHDTGAEAGDAELSPGETRTTKEEELHSAAEEETALEEEEADEEAERRTPEQQPNCGDVLQEETFSQASEEVRPGGGAAPSGVRRRNRRRRRRL